MNPERYVNFYGDGLGDILVSVASTFVISLLMYWIVYDHVIYMSFRGSLNRLKLELKTL